MRSAERYRWVILALAFVAQFSNALAAQSVAPLAPIFQPELGLSKAEVGVFSSAAFAGAWGVLLAAGFMTDRFGVRRMFSLGQMVTGTLVLGMSMVSSFVQAVAVMLAAGVGRGLTGPGVAKAVSDWFPPALRATAMGVNQAAIPAAGIVAASLLPSLALAIGWRASIAVVGVAILSGALATALLYRDVPRPLPTSRGGGRSGLREAIRKRELWAVVAIGPLFSSVQFSLITYLALFLKEHVLVEAVPAESARIVAAGGFLALCYVGGIVSRVLWGLVSDRLLHGRRMAVLATISALSAVMSGVVGSLGPGHPMWLLSVVVFAYGATAMGWQGLHLVVATETAGPRSAASGVGLCLTGSQLGFVVGPPLFGFIVDAARSYQAGWLALAALSATGALVAAALAGREKRPIWSATVR